MLLQLSARMQRLGQGFLEQCSPAVRFLAAEAAVERATTSKERIERVVPDLHKVCASIEIEHLTDNISVYIGFIVF